MRFAGLRSIATNSAYLLGGQAVTVVTRIAYVFLLASWLQPDAYGTLNYALSWYLTLIAFTYLGQDVVLSRTIGKDREAAPALAGSTLAIRVAAILITAVVFMIISCFETDPSTRALLLIFTFALVGRSIWIWSVSIFTAVEHNRWTMMLDVVLRPAELLVLLAYVRFFGPSVPAIAFVHALSWCVQGAAGLAVALRLTKLDLAGWSARVGPLLRTSVPGIIFAIGMAFFLQAPVIMFRRSAGISDELGHFALAYQMLTYLLIFPSVLSAAALPVLARCSAREDGKDRSMALSILLLIPPLGVAAGVTASWLATPAVSLMFGSRYAPAGEILAEATWLLAPLSLATLLQQFVLSKDDSSRIGAIAPLLGVAALMLLFPPLASFEGHTGALVSVAISSLVWVGATLIALTRSGFFAPRRNRA